MKIILDLPALERLIGNDTEIEVELRNSIVQAFAKKHLKGEDDVTVKSVEPIKPYDIRVAESITLSGQYFTKNCVKYVEKQGLVVITGDTDSLFIGGLKNWKLKQKNKNSGN